MSNGRAGSDFGVFFFITVIVLVFLFVWPGPLRYDYRDNATIKIDRLTHQVYGYDKARSGWVER